MARKKRDTLTSQQHMAIQLALEGRKWSDIADTVGVSLDTTWRWRQDTLFRTQLTVSQEAILNETSLLFNTYVSAGYATLYRMAVNKNGEFDEKTQYESAIKLVELPFRNMEQLKVIEHNRMESILEYGNNSQTPS
jgi:hypothetical protein